MKTSLKFLIGLALLETNACGGAQEEVRPVRRLTAADEILRVGAKWSAILPEQGLLSPPSPISFFKNKRSSQITLEEKSAEETLVIVEHLQMRSGGEVNCSTAISHTVGVRYGRRGDEAAVELSRPAIAVARNCDGQHPEPMLNEPSKSALFVLREDALVAIEPPLEKRKYLPMMP